MGETNESFISYEDLLSTALGESGLNLDDLFGNVPGNVLSQATFNDSDLLSTGDGDFLDNINLTGDFSQDNSFINFAAPNNSLLSSSFASTVPNIQVSEVQQTFLEQPPAIASLFNQGTSGQSDFNTQSEQLTNAAASLDAPDVNSSAPSPLLLNLLNSGNGFQMSSIGSVTQPREQFNSENNDSRLESSPDVTINHVEERKSGVNEDEEDDEEEELGHTDTYAEYVPSKLTIGRRHPDPVVETSSLSSVTPPDIWYALKLPQEVINYCYLSALQLEAVVYACQQHETFLADGTRAGFLIGDGAGVGKGRTVAGIIYENYLHGRKRALWFSVSNDLKYDAERDLNDIGCCIDVSLLNKFKYKAKLSSKVNGKVKKGVVFATYSSLIGESQGQDKYNTRMSQLLNWCGHDFDGVIVLDECHKAKNLVPTGSSKPTKTGLAVLELQNKLPKARVVYCSATGASEPKNMAYMSRLGIWGPGTPFREFSDFIQAVEKRGVGAMEIVAMDMKLRGMYMTRQLSFTGVTFDIKELPLSRDFIEMYNDSVKLWIEAREKFDQAAELMGADGRAKKTIWGQFWSAHQRFFKYLCIASKVDNVVDIAKEAIDHGKCVIVGLQSTGEARTIEQLEENGGDLTDFVSTAKGVLQSLIKKHFPAPGNKLEELFGLDSETNGRSSPSSQQLTPVKRKKKAAVASKPKKFKTAFERIYNISASESDSDDSDKGNSFMQDESQMTTIKEEEILTADSGESTAGEDDFNPFGNSGSEDEDPWLHRKSKKGSRGKFLTGSPDISVADPTFNALAAAGLKVSNMSWSIPSKQETARQINGINYSRNSPLDHLNRLHHSASAPAFSSLTASSSNAVERCRSMKKELLAKVEMLGNALPPNTLDKLIHDLGGPDKVAEMTGRKNRVVSNEDGTISYESRSKQDVSLELLNIAEKKRFMDGEKNVAIISEAASSGVSLQADRRAKNQRRRVHITLELPWSADKAIQQFGRSHRSNQVSAPEYLFLISELAGERRFASIVAKRLESLCESTHDCNAGGKLVVIRSSTTDFVGKVIFTRARFSKGALTHGDRRATESQDLSRYNFDNKHGKTALEAVLKAVTDLETPMIPPPKDYRGNFFQDIRDALVGVGLVIKNEKSGIATLDKDCTNMSRFLNRILGLEVELQNRLFAYFTETLSVVVQQAKRSGRWDEGILDLGAHGEAVNDVSVQTFAGNSVFGTATTELHTVSVERGMSWEESLELRASKTYPDNGYYLSNQTRNNKKTAILVICEPRNKKKNSIYVSVYRPNTGLQTKQDTLEDVKKKYKMVADYKARSSWIEQYDSALNQCSHAYWKGNCKRITLGIGCEVGRRQRTFHILCGSVLSVWSKLEALLAGQPGANSKVQIVRCRKSNDSRIVGCLIPSNCVPALVKVLSPDEAADQEPIIIM